MYIKQKNVSTWVPLLTKNIIVYSLIKYSQIKFIFLCIIHKHIALFLDGIKRELSPLDTKDVYGTFFPICVVR